MKNASHSRHDFGASNRAEHSLGLGRRAELRDRRTPQISLVERESLSKRVRPQPVIDIIFPGNRVHLIAGASGSGKTTWLMQLIEIWRKGDPVYGFASHPVPFVYLSYDRDIDDFEDTCERLKIEPSTYHFISPEGADMAVPLVNMMTRIQTAHPETRLYIVEGLASQTPDGKINDQKIVGRWLREIQAFCKRYGVTVIGVVHTAKTKERDRYREPRAKIAGCAAWGGYSSTVITLEEKDAASESELRELLILPRNSKKLKYTLDFKDGFLTEVEDLTPIVKAPKFEIWLSTVQPGESFNIEQIRACGLSDSRIYTELDRALARHKIEKLGPGNYRKTPDSVN